MHLPTLSCSLHTTFKTEKCVAKKVKLCAFGHFFISNLNMKKLSNVARKVSDHMNGRPGGVCFQNKNAHDIKHASLHNCQVSEYCDDDRICRI